MCEKQLPLVHGGGGVRKEGGTRDERLEGGGEVWKGGERSRLFFATHPHTQTRHLSQKPPTSSISAASARARFRASTRARTDAIPAAKQGEDEEKETEEEEEEEEEGPSSSIRCPLLSPTSRPPAIPSGETEGVGPRPCVVLTAVAAAAAAAADERTRKSSSLRLTFSYRSAAAARRDASSAAVSVEKAPVRPSRGAAPEDGTTRTTYCRPGERPVTVKVCEDEERRGEEEDEEEGEDGRS
jgi:hypothetical protein